MHVRWGDKVLRESARQPISRHPPRGRGRAPREREPLRAPLDRPRGEEQVEAHNAAVGGAPGAGAAAPTAPAAAARPRRRRRRGATSRAAPAAAPRDARGDGHGAGLVAFLTLGRSRAENARDALADVRLVLAGRGAVMTASRHGDAVHFHRLGALGDGFVLADAETDRVLGAGDVSARKAGARVRTRRGRRERARAPCV